MAGFDMDAPAGGPTPTEMLGKLTLKTWMDDKLDFDHIAKCREIGVQRYKDSVKEVMTQLDGTIDSTSPFGSESLRSTGRVAEAPARTPRTSSTTTGGFGSTAAAPIARRAIDYLLTGAWPSEEDIAAVQRGEAAAPIGTPRRAEDVPLPGEAGPQ